MEKITLDSIQLIGYQIDAKWDELWEKMPAAWQKLYQSSGSIPNRVSDSFTDITLSKIGDCYHQFIGAEVKSTEIVLPGFAAIEIPGQTYVRYRHQGPLEEIAASYGKIYAWLEKNGYDHDEHKVDRGYTEQGNEPFHDLHVRIGPAIPWRLIWNNQ